MEDDRIQDIAELTGGDLSEEEREILVGRMLGDRDSTDLGGVLSLPELNPANNMPLPFSVHGTFLGGWNRQFFLPVAVNDVEYGDHAKRIARYFKKILGDAAPPCFCKSLDFSFPIQEGIGALQITLAREESHTTIEVNHIGSEGREGWIEFWEKGVMVRRSRCFHEIHRPAHRVEPGISVTVRHSSNDSGSEILLSPLEFSQRDWKVACVAACFDGDLKEGLRIVREELGTDTKGDGWIEQLSGRIAALIAFTRSEQCILTPAPAVRSSQNWDEIRLHAFEPVWRGIVQCWAGAADIPNPWGESNSRANSLLSEEVSILLQACINSATQPGDIISVAPKYVEGDLALMNGWAALQGWASLLAKNFEEAHGCFNIVQPIEGDPFGLRHGFVLTKHLILSSGTGTFSKDLELSNQQVWKETLSPIL